MTGTAHSQMLRYVEATPTIDTSAYAAGDLIGSAVIELENAVGGDTGSALVGGLVQSVVVTDLSKQSANLDVVFFDADPTNTTFSDNDAFDPDDADILNIFGTAAVIDWSDFNDNSEGQTLNLAMPFVLDSGSSLWAVLVSRGAPTYSATALTLRVGVFSA